MIAAVEGAWMVEGIERVFVDIEFTFESSDDVRPFCLQTRPVTSYHPLPSKMLSIDGSKPMLFNDNLLAEQGLNVPLSVMGIGITFGDFMEQFSGALKTDRLHPEFYQSLSSQTDPFAMAYIDPEFGRLFVNIGFMGKVSLSLFLVCCPPSDSDRPAR
jgi:hypothetical protein